MSRFVGRERELADLDALLDRSMDGHGALAMLVGQPGIGKTRLVLEFSDRARHREARVLSGICHEEPGMPSYWPWRQVIRDLAHSYGDDGFKELCGGTIAELALVAPELDARDSPVEPAGAASDASSRFQLFDTVCQLLLKVAAERPTVLVIENLHLADTPSLRLLEFVAPVLSQVPLLIVGSYRDVELSRGHPMTNTLGRLVTQPGFHRIRLRGFELHETAALMEEITGGVAAGEVTAAIHRQTEGNPLFVIQVVRYLVDAGYLPPSTSGTSSLPATVRVPEGVREAVGQRLNRLSGRCNSLLGTASVLGRIFELEELNALSEEFTDEERSACLEAALDAHILEEAPSTGSRLQFTHALIRETLYDEIPATRRIRLHAAAAETIERLRKEKTDNVLSRLAHHYFQGQLVTGPNKVIEYASRAAARATSIMAYEDAARCWALAIDCADMSGRKREHSTCEMRMQLGEAQRKGGDVTSAMQTFMTVAKTAEEIGDVELYAEAALEFESARWRPGLPGDLSVELLERAIGKLSNEDGATRCKLLASLGRALSYTCWDHRAASMAHESIEIARRIGDPSALCTALDHGVLALRRQPDRAATRLGYCREQLDIAERLGSAEHAAAAHSTLRSELLEIGEIEAFEQDFEDYQALTRKLRQPHYQYQVAFVDAMRTLLAGDFERVPALAENALRVGSRLQGADAHGVFAMQMFTLHRERGTLGQFAPLVHKVVAHDEGSPIWSPGLALLYAEIGEIEQARSLLAELSANDFSAVNRDELWLTSMAYLAEVCAVVSDAKVAQAIYRCLLPHRTRNLVFGPTIVCYGPVDRLLGLLAATLRQWEDADRHFSVALKGAKKLKSGPCVARVQCDHARALLRRDPKPASDEALALLEEVRELCATYGMDGLDRMAQHLQGIARNHGVSNGCDDLTSRELEVLRLITDGCTNKQIAETLTISLATVATHARNILAKTGTNNRTAAAAHAREKRLLD